MNPSMKCAHLLFDVLQLVGVQRIHVLCCEQGRRGEALRRDVGRRRSECKEVQRRAVAGKHLCFCGAFSGSRRGCGLYES